MKCLGVVVCMLVVGAARAEDPQPAIADLAWLAGCWKGGETDGAYEEQWMNPGGRTMLGMSRTVVGDKTVAFEFLRIHEEADGIYYTSTPSGQTQASFKLVKFDGTSVIFENPEHDFPQRIIYRLQEDGALIATIEGTSKGALKQVEFPMHRVECD